MVTALFGTILFCLALAGAILLMLYVLVPLLKAIGWIIGTVVKAIGWIILHVFEFVAGTLGDILRCVGAVLGIIALVPMSVLNVVVGRWSAAGHYAEAVKREGKVGVAGLYRILIRRPLKLLYLHGLLEGVEERVPEAMAAAPTSDKPRHRTGQFDGYEIVGSLRGGGSGAKLYVARPDVDAQKRYPGMPPRVVIKSFGISEGSSLPQIVRESRALESAKKLGLVFEHGMDEHRFFYVMPYHAGDHLGIVTRQLHGQGDGHGLRGKPLSTAMGYACDLLRTLATYHEGGLWHKDVKPENIIIDGRGAHLVDLGLVTPLRSAMTLTTHGTEYFRDPELVRQALRGVKVHQVNGAKFDIYAAGAVLYFMTENTFPAHGALSRFAKKSPDALRWVIRRAMADYTHRYEEVSEMLADLRAVANAPDPFMLRPAELPSMQGETQGTYEPEVAAADETLAQPSMPAADVEPKPTVSPFTGRPKIRLTNWWTGAHAVDPGAVDPAVAPAAHSAARHGDAGIRSRVRAGRLSKREAAREQVAAARARAKEIRVRAHEHRRRVAADKRPSPALAGLALVVMAVLVTGAGLTLYGKSNARREVAIARTMVKSSPRLILFENIANPDDADILDQKLRLLGHYKHEGYELAFPEQIHAPEFPAVLASFQAGEESSAAALEMLLDRENLAGVLILDERSGVLVDSIVGDQLPLAPSPPAPPALELPIEITSGDPLLIINEHPAKRDPAVLARVSALLEKIERQGVPLREDAGLEATLRNALPPHRLEMTEEIPERLAAILAHEGIRVVYISARPGDGDAAARTEMRILP